MSTPLIPQEIYLIERYTSADYFKKLRDAFAETVQAAEEALAHVMRTLPPDYRSRPRWQQPDITWGSVVLPNFRDTLQMLEDAYVALLRGDPSAIEIAGNVNTAFAGQIRDYPCDWIPEPYATRFDEAGVQASRYASNIGFTAFIGWIKGSLSSRYNADSRGPLDAPPTWPIYRLNPAVRVATDEPVTVTGVYLPDADESCAQFFYAGPHATSTSVGYDPKTGQNISEVDTVWTLVERVADSGGGVPGEEASSDVGERRRPNVPAGQPCPEAGWWFTPAQANSRRWFKQGEIMPALGGDYGNTFWQWSPDQSAPQL
ncbi:hypothetical protein [Aromatoleum petrolei]|uniref:Uncharacterized protein n=1 Tax=Aromatoleum petrolei TaxID=76116 RepID=A0ABX1MRY6_9RHOO|nr:hypothetical protein [Aromatoleum petrolei]NMF87882.1 hypothetical protein [Aromatoleum petrolei]QTQ35250.1 Uncharacterized protein ToN1_10810 [Aromatoleum petrolei]